MSMPLAVRETRTNLQKLIPDLIAACPDRRPEAIIREVTTALQMNPALQKCTQESIILSVLQASQYGLTIGADKMAGAYLVPFKNQCQMLPSYKGMIELITRSPDVTAPRARIVYDTDDLTIVEGSAPRLEHIPARRGKPNEATHAYAVCTYRGEPTWEIMTRAEIERIRDKAPGYKSPESPWRHHTFEMWKKTAIHRLLKRMPIRISIPTENEAPQTNFVASTVTQRDDGLTLEANEYCDPPAKTLPPPAHCADLENDLARIRSARRPKTVQDREMEAYEKWSDNEEALQEIKLTADDRREEFTDDQK